MAWAGGGGAPILAGCLVSVLGGVERPPALIEILTPANLFTGVLGCGVICGLNLWANARFLPAGQRMPAVLNLPGALACVSFTGLGLKAYWGHSGLKAWLLLAGTLGAGWLVAALVRRR